MGPWAGPVVLSAGERPGPAPLPPGAPPPEAIPQEASCNLLFQLGFFFLC